MQKILSFILICMMIVELLMITLWILAWMGISAIPANVLPMQIIALITALIATSVVFTAHKKKQVKK